MRISKSFFIFFVCLIFIFSSTVFYTVSAQETSVPTVTSVQKIGPTDDPNVPTKPFPRTTGSVERSGVVKEMRPNLISQRADLMQQNREKFKQDMIAKRQEASDQAKQKRAEFQAKTQEIKDQRKKELVQRMDEKISTLNQNRTNKMVEVLDRLQSILEKISQKADEAKSRGIDTASVAEAITSAETSITTAKSAISNQAGKEYVITLTSTGEADMKSTVGTTITQFKTDMIDVQKKIIDAKEAVLKAAQELKKTMAATKVNENGTPGAMIQ